MKYWFVGSYYFESLTQLPSLRSMLTTLGVFGPIHPGIVSFHSIPIYGVGPESSNSHLDLTSPSTEPAQARQSLFRNNQEPLKIWVSSMYEVPVFSAVIWMLPLAGKKGIDWQFNTTLGNPYTTSVWHADACCHPKPPGHLILSLVLAYCIMEEEKVLLSYSELDKAEGEHDFTTDVTPVLREPLYLSPQEDELYVKNSLRYGGFDFTDSSKGEDSWKSAIKANNGWTWYADNKDKDKYGYIADGVSGGQHIAISLTGAKHGKVEISYVISYENFGVALVWLDGSADNTHTDTLCKKEANLNPKAGEPQPLVAKWDYKASVPKLELLKASLNEGEVKTLHVCLTPRSNDQKGTENRFKLLGARVY